MACNSGRNSRTMGRYEDSRDYNPNGKDGACEQGCYNSAGNNESDNKCNGCNSKECVNGCGECSVDCGPKRGCSDACTGSCGGCGNSCGGCSGACSGCSGSCSGGCSGTCSTACAQQCSGGCTGGCVGNCNHGCASEEVEELYKNLHLSRIAESDDINVIKKIIYRLFENLKISKIYDGSSYANELNDGTDLGLMDNWSIDENGNMNFSLLLNKTFKAVIENLNNLNQNRVEIEQDKMNPVQIWEVPDPTDDTKTIKLNTVDRDAALYWIECLKKIYETTAPVK